MSDNPIVEPAEQFYNNSAEAEPTKPAEQADVTKQEDQEPGQEVEILDKPVEAESKDEVKAEESESKDEEQTAQYIELDGKEISLDDVRDGLNNGLMQKDYTKKTTVLADERKTFETERDSDRANLLESQAKVSEMTDLLTVLVKEDEAIDWAELKDDDPDRYIELKEKADNRREALAKVKEDRQIPATDPAFIAEEQQKLLAANPDWLDGDKKTTETYSKDMTLLNDYAVKAGFTTEEFSQLTCAHHMITILKAAKYDELQDKGREIKSKREKVPVVTKPKANKTEQSKSMADTFYGQTG